MDYQLIIFQIFSSEKELKQYDYKNYVIVYELYKQDIIIHDIINKTTNMSVIDDIITFNKNLEGVKEIIKNGVK